MRLHTITVSFIPVWTTIGLPLGISLGVYILGVKNALLFQDIQPLARLFIIAIHVKNELTISHFSCPLL